MPYLLYYRKWQLMIHCHFGLPMSMLNAAAAVTVAVRKLLIWKLQFFPHLVITVEWTEFHYLVSYFRFCIRLLLLLSFGLFTQFDFFAMPVWKVHKTPASFSRFKQTKFGKDWAIATLKVVLDFRQNAAIWNDCTTGDWKSSSLLDFLARKNRGGICQTPEWIFLAIYQWLGLLSKLGHWLLTTKKTANVRHFNFVGQPNLYVQCKHIRQ